MPNETMGKTIAVALGVCVVCSVFVSTAAVCLKPFQDDNKMLDKNRNILIAAGVWKKGGDVDELFKQIETRVIDLSTGTEIGSRFWDSSTEQWVTRGTSPASVDERKEEKTPATRLEIHNDLAGIKYRARQALVYVRKDGDRIERLVLPMHGKGLWSTMYGFLALDGDLTTVGSFAFYQHGETPGLGGEVDNPKWKDSWLDKKAFGDAWEPEITLVKGTAGKGAGHEHEVDGLSGATLTARGVENLVRFWLGEEGYGPYLKNLASGRLSREPLAASHHHAIDSNGVRSRKRPNPRCSVLPVRKRDPSEKGDRHRRHAGNSRKNQPVTEPVPVFGLPSLQFELGSDNG